MNRPPLLIQSTPQLSITPGFIFPNLVLKQTFFIFYLFLALTVAVRYGCYANYQMVLGPGSSRLIETSSLFVEQIQAKSNGNKGVSLYCFNEKPQLNVETNWSLSTRWIIGSYNRKGFSLWLNKGSKIWIKLEVETSRSNHFQVVILKGERRFKTLVPELLSFTQAKTPAHHQIKDKYAEQAIEEDDKYHISIINTDRRNINIFVNFSITSKIHDLTKTIDMCSTSSSSCRLKLQFPSTQYVILKTPANGETDGWYIELAFMARVITYIAVLGLVVIIIFLVLKRLGAFDSGERDETVYQVSETTPLTIHDNYNQTAAGPSTYGTDSRETGDNKIDLEAESSCSEDLYDEKLCVICYDDQRNSFFTPCGHCATCYDCAQRIMKDGSKVCPICRRFIHKVKRLFSS